MSKDFSFKIRKKYKLLRPSEQKVADVLLTPDFDISELSIEGLAELAGVSQPTIMRFANAVDLKGYKELKRKLIEEKAVKDPFYKISELTSFPVSPEDKLVDVPSKVILTNIKHLEDALKSISSYQLIKAVEAITKARSVAIFGVENSACVASDLSTKLLYMGIQTYTYTDPYLQAVHAKNLTSGDVAVGISYTGSSRHTVDALRLAKEAGATTITITNFEKSLLNRYGDIVLSTGGVQYMYGNAIFSRCTQIAVVDMLYTGILLSDYEKYGEAISLNGQTIEPFSYDEI